MNFTDLMTTTGLGSSIMLAAGLALIAWLTATGKDNTK